VRVGPQRERFEIPLDVVDGALLLHRIAVEDAVAVRRQHRDVTVLQIDDRPRVPHDRTGVGGDEVLAVADAEQHRRPVPRHHDLAGLGLPRDRQAVGPFDRRERHDEALLEGGTLGVFDQVGEDFGVGLGGEAMARRLEPHPQDVGILHNAVVHQRDLASAVRVGMRIDVRRRAMRRPARMRDAARPKHRLTREQIGEALDPAREFPGLDAASILQGHAGRVVAAILEAREPLEENGRRLPRSDVTDDSTHAPALLQDWGPA